MKINNFDTNLNTYVIAEVGGNHNGNPEIAMELVEAAAETGANAVKFQSYKAELLVHPKQEPLPIVRKYYKNQLDRFKSLELSDNNYQELIDRCKKLNIDFLTTPFDLQILDKFSVNMPVIKIASGDLTYHKLIKQASLLNKPVILSTGRSSLNEVVNTVSFLRQLKCKNYTLLHCVSEYPAKYKDLNLYAIKLLKRKFKCEVGYSDHSKGIEAALAAVAIGASYIEKHLTLDVNDKGPDHRASAEPHEFKRMVEGIRNLELALGSERKKATKSELQGKFKSRRSIFASRNLLKNTKIKKDDIICKRPVIGISSENFQKVVGSKVNQNIEENDSITWKKLKKK